MNMYILVLFLIIFNYVLLKNNKKLYCILTGLILFLLISLKDPFLGCSDTLTIYYPSYLNVMTKSFIEVFNRYVDESFLFYIIAKIISLFTSNISIFYAIVNIPIVYSVTKIIYKRSKIPYLSFILFYTLNYYFFSFIALKFSVSFAFLILALDYLIDNNKKNFIIYTLLSFLFHYTSLIFIICLFVNNRKYKKTDLLFILLFIISVVLFKNNYRSFIFKIFSNGRYSMYSSRESELSLVHFFINYLFLFYLILFKTNIEEENLFNKYINILELGTIFSGLTVLLAEFIRISMLFSFIIVILVPLNIYYHKGFEKRFFSLVIITFTVLYCFTSAVPNLNLVPYRFLF